MLDALGRADARAALETVLREEPHLVGLQEWGWSRRALLPRTDYAWFTPVYGGNAVGARRDRYALLGARVHALAGIGPVRPRRTTAAGVGPAGRHGGRLRDRLHDRTVSIVDYHLVPGVQARSSYRADRPLLAARHAREVRRLQALVGARLEAGDVTYAVGDSNFHGLRLPGLTSAWEGRPESPGTLGASRRVDDVFGPGPAAAVTLLATASDHKAVLAARPDGPDQLPARQSGDGQARGSTIGSRPEGDTMSTTHVLPSSLALPRPAVPRRRRSSSTYGRGGRGTSSTSARATRSSGSPSARTPGSPCRRTCTVPSTGWW